ncbi:MAG: DUF72 domain-containing protein [Chloroflexi bacterium]|nr:DUF72 domain-containing protein [Chloroflexota bacterium]
MSSTIRVGCCGFQKSQQVYYEHFKLVEIEQTFYKLPKLETVARWREHAPSDFIFTLKAWQLITHEPFSPTYRRMERGIPRVAWEQYGAFRPTPEVHEAWKRTYAAALELGAKVVVFQCPPWFDANQQNIENMRKFFSTIERGSLVCAWEPRGRWAEGKIKDLCSDLELIHCVDPFQNKSVTGSTGYFRMHGGPDYQHQHTDAELGQLRTWCEQFDEVYCLFNNVFLWEDAHRFKNILTPIK